MIIEFYDEDKIPEQKIKYVTLITFFYQKMVLVRHKKRQTWEFPGGHREISENCITAAERELYEETGAISSEIKCICVFNVIKNEKDSMGKLYHAEIKRLGKLPDFEMAEINLFNTLPQNLTYPEIQKELLKKYKSLK